jgi:hypothetical protein
MPTIGRCHPADLALSNFSLRQVLAANSASEVRVMTYRVHELAKELGLTAREILSKCADYGEFVKSSSSTLHPRLIEKLRADLGALRSHVDVAAYGRSADIASSPGDDGGFAAAYERARKSSKPTHSEHTPGAIEAAIYREAIDPGRTRRGHYTPEERDRAMRLTKLWASTWFPDVLDWIRLSGGAHVEVAIQLSRDGVTAADAGLRLGFGRVDLGRDTIFERLVKRTAGYRDAVRQIHEFRRSERRTG